MQHIVPEVTIPPEVTPENVTTYIVDTGGESTILTSRLCPLSDHIPAGPQDRSHLESEIRKAHVICVVYAIDNPNSFDRLPTYWLPYFRSLGVNVCVAILLSLYGLAVQHERLRRCQSYLSGTRSTCEGARSQTRHWKMRFCQ